MFLWSLFDSTLQPTTWNLKYIYKIYLVFFNSEVSNSDLSLELQSITYVKYQYYLKSIIRYPIQYISADLDPDLWVVKATENIRKYICSARYLSHADLGDNSGGTVHEKHVPSWRMFCPNVCNVWVYLPSRSM